jgi:DnaJ-class molecular chaperone
MFGRYDRCHHCGYLKFLDSNGYCSDCSGYLRISGYPTSPSPTSVKCPYCNGTGRVTHMIGPATECTYCRGTGRR